MCTSDFAISIKSDEDPGNRDEDWAATHIRIDDRSWSHSCAVQEPLDVVGGSIYDTASW